MSSLLSNVVFHGKLEELIKNAVGLEVGRNDQISIVNLPFQTDPANEFVEESTTWFEDADGISNLLLVIIAIAGAIFLLRGLMSKLKNEQIFVGNVQQKQLIRKTGRKKSVIMFLKIQPKLQN